MAQEMTLSQLQQQGGTPVPSPSPTPQPMTFAQLQQLGGTPINPQASSYNPTSIGNITDDVVQGVTKGIPAFASQAYDSLKQIAAQHFNNLQGDITPMAQGLAGQTDQKVNAQNVTQALSAAGHATIGTASDLAQLVLSPISAVTGTAINNIADLTSDSKTLQNVATSQPVSGGLDVVNHAQQAIQDWAQQHPDAYKQLSDIVNVATLAAGGEAAPGEIAGTAADINAAKEGVSNAVGAVGDAFTPKAPSPETLALQKAGSDAAHQASLTKDWTAPTGINKGSYNGARKVLAQNPDAPSTLASMGVDPYAYVEDGNFNTAELANDIRDAATQKSNQKLRPALQLADYYTAPTPAEDIVNQAVNMAKGDTSLTRTARAQVIKTIQSEGTGLATDHPDGLSLTNAHDEKITYSQNGGYNPDATPETNNIATANRYLGRALGKNVEDNAPASLPVHEVNANLSKAYGAADYVQALNTKKAPVTLAQTLARGGAKFGGAAIARMLPIGGDIVSEFGGYQIGKFLENALENMSHQGRAEFISRIQTEEPEAYKSLQAFIDKHGNGNPEIKRLMAPSAPISPLSNGNPIPAMNSKGTYTGGGTVAQTQ